MPRQPPEPPRWKGAEALELVYKLNERAFTLLKASATRQRELWCALDSQTIQRAARVPFVILDARFTDGPWWRSVAANQEPTDTSVGSMLWPEPIAEQLVGELLVFAWHTAKSDRRVAQLSLGMALPVAASVAGLTPQQLTEIPARYKGNLRLRWQEDVEFWTRLINAARDGNEGVFSDAAEHAKLLVLGGLIGRPPLAGLPG
jgi:hypothetical protein